MADYTKRGEFSKQFWKSLTEGQLTSILNYASNPENGLDVQLRGNYINIYYRGGNILRIKPRSFFFDKFYFYVDCKNGDLSTRKSKILDASKGKEGSLMPQEQAKSIIDKLEKQAQNLLLLLDESPTVYFSAAKKAIDNWLNAQLSILGINHNEKANQHLISLKNKSFDHSDLVVIDMEYAISQKASFSERGGNPRPDIVAADKSGRVHVIELKYKFQATEGDAGVEPHIKDFENTIGRDVKGDFVSEMSNIVEAKKKLGLIDKRCKIDTNKKPVFDLAFRGSVDDILLFEQLYGHFKNEGRVNDIIYLEDDKPLNLVLRK